MILHRDGWRYSGRVPAFFTGQAGCFCCQSSAPAYYTLPNLITPCCSITGIPRTLRATVTATASPLCVSAGLIGKSVVISYAGDHPTNGPFWSGWDGTSTGVGFLMWCQDFGGSGIRMCGKSMCGGIPSPASGGLGNILIQMGVGGSTCSPFYIPPVEIDFTNSTACCPGTGGTVRVTWTVTE